MSDQPTPEGRDGLSRDAATKEGEATSRDNSFRLFDDDDFEQVDSGKQGTSPHKLAMAMIFLTISGAFVVLAVTLYSDDGNKIKIPRLEQRMINGKEEPSEQAFMLPGLWKPKLLKVEEALVADEDDVIGVSVDGTFRAYQVKAFISNGGRVLNDVVNGRAISVTYCDIWDLARVFTLDNGGEEIQLGLAGWRDHQMDLNYKDLQYGQKTSKEIPLDDYPHERMTWLEWKSAHPDTHIYLGDAVPHQVD